MKNKSVPFFDFKVDIILAMKKENPGYSPGMICRMLKSQISIYYWAA
jgi:hypothetical protein